MKRHLDQSKRFMQHELTQQPIAFFYFLSVDDKDPLTAIDGLRAVEMLPRAYRTGVYDNSKATIKQFVMILNDASDENRRRHQPRARPRFRTRARLTSRNAATERSAGSPRTRTLASIARGGASASPSSGPRVVSGPIAPSPRQPLGTLYPRFRTKPVRRFAPDTRAERAAREEPTRLVAVRPFAVEAVDARALPFAREPPTRRSSAVRAQSSRVVLQSDARAEAGRAATKRESENAFYWLVGDVEACGALIFLDR